MGLDGGYVQCRIDKGSEEFGTKDTRERYLYTVTIRDLFVYLKGDLD